MSHRTRASEFLTRVLLSAQPREPFVWLACFSTPTALVICNGMEYDGFTDADFVSLLFTSRLCRLSFAILLNFSRDLYWLRKERQQVSCPLQESEHVFGVKRIFLLYPIPMFVNLEERGRGVFLCAPLWGYTKLRVAIFAVSLPHTLFASEQLIGVLVNTISLIKWHQSFIPPFSIVPEPLIFSSRFGPDYSVSSAIHPVYSRQKVGG